MSLYPVADHELEAIAALVNQAYRGTEGWTHEGEYLGGQRTDAGALRRDLAQTPQAVLLALRDTTDGPLLGVVWLEPAEDDAWYLGLLTVRSDIQARSLGRQLLDEAETYAGQRGARRMRMTVLNLRQPLIDWYVRRGYRDTGEIEPFPYGDQRFGIPKRDDLAFVVLEKDLPGAPA